MGVKIIVAPVLTDVVSQADLRTHLKLASDGTQDELASLNLAAAHGEAEHYTGRPIGLQTRELALDAFPAGSAGAIDLGCVVAAITSVKYIDPLGVQQTLDPSAYTLDDYGLVCWLVPAFNTAWPDTLATANAVKVRFTAGDVPANVKNALLVGAGYLKENPGSEPGDLPDAFYSLLNAVARRGM